MTAVEWLIHQYIKDGLFKKGVYEQAKEMEKQQIIDAYNKSFELRDKPYSTADKYYTSTYASKGSDDHIVDTNEMVSSQTEISDEEIEKEALSYFNEHHCNVFEYDGFIAGIKWYREQLKQKQ